MFVPCIIRRSRNDQQYSLICANPLFCILVPTCFGSTLPSSGSFLDPSELLEIQIEWVVLLPLFTFCSNGVLLAIASGFHVTFLRDYSVLANSYELLGVITSTLNSLFISKC
jgi:hypothetical protein